MLLPLGSFILENKISHAIFLNEIVYWEFVNIDKLDHKILKILLRDSRLSFRQIAKEIKVSTDTVASRFKKLVKNGIILQCSALLDISKLGYKLATIEIDVESKRCDYVIKKLNQMPEVLMCSRMIGASDISVIVKVSSITSLDEIRNKIERLDYVNEVSISIWTNYKFYWERQLG
jgi:DNA-binding Lrp family transcriptional regulator